MKKGIWITWEKQIRNRSMAKNMGVKLYEIIYNKSRLVRYIYCIIETIKVIYQEKPDIVFAQNPSIILTYLILLMRYLLSYYFVSDSHFFGVIAYNNNIILQKVLDYCNKRIDLVIVTNDEHASYIEKLGGHPFIYEDPLPDISMYEEPKSEEKIVFFICSFDIDEPLEEVFLAAESLKDEGFKFYVSGNYNKAGIETSRYPFIKFLGYVSEADYYSYLYQSHIILDFTINENCLVCGAYEALAADRVLITSRTKALMSYFANSALYTEHKKDEICRSIRYADANQNKLFNNIIKWKKRAIEKNNEKSNLLKQKLNL